MAHGYYLIHCSRTFHMLKFHPERHNLKSHTQYTNSYLFTQSSEYSICASDHKNKHEANKCLKRIVVTVTQLFQWQDHCTNTCPIKACNGPVAVLLPV